MNRCNCFNDYAEKKNFNFSTKTLLSGNGIDISIYLCPPPFEEEGVYCFANVGRSVGRSVDQMVSADYLEYCVPQSLHISHIGWS